MHLTFSDIPCTYGMMTEALQSEVVSCRLVGDREAKMKDLGYPLTNSVELICFTSIASFLILVKKVLQLLRTMFYLM